MRLISDRYPLFDQAPHRDIKDPCLVKANGLWHIFGSGGSTESESWGLVHATSSQLEGPWQFRPTVWLNLPDGPNSAAPGVIHDGRLFHMFLQTNFMEGGGSIEHYTSFDGDRWQHAGTALRSVEGTREHGIYDPHPAVIRGHKYLVYSGFPAGTRKPQPDIFLAVSDTNTWAGPWRRLGVILDHDDVSAHHNMPGEPDYEWGIEGAQLVELSDGKLLLVGVCFLPEGEFGTRQRVFTATAHGMSFNGRPPRFRSNGPLLRDDRRGEDGHASVVVEGDELIVCYQRRWLRHFWRYGLARFRTDAGSVEVSAAA